MAQRDLTLAAQRQDQRLSVHIRLPSRSPPIQDAMRKKEATWDTTKLVLELGIKLRICRRKVVW